MSSEDHSPAEPSPDPKPGPGEPHMSWRDILLLFLLIPVAIGLIGVTWAAVIWLIGYLLGAW